MSNLVRTETPTVSAEWFKTAADTDVTTALNAAISLSNFKEILISTDTTISGTLTIPAGKKLRFIDAGRLIGTATVSGGIVEANALSHIFSSTITANIEGTYDEWFSARWYGASPSVGDNQPLLQKAIDVCVANNLPSLYLPKGTYGIAKGLLLYKGATDQVELHIYGDNKARGAEVAATIINCTHADNFGIGVHLGKSCVFEKFALVGVNQLNYTLAQGHSADSTYLVNSSRDNRYSPYAGFVFDLFHSSVTGSNRYPGFESYYASASSGGGSTSCIIRDVGINGFTVGRVLSPNGVTQNNECHVFDGCWISNCREGFAAGNSQEKITVVTNEYLWGSVRTCYHTNKYGNLNGDLPSISNVNIAGNIFELVNSPNGGYKSRFLVNNLHAEQLYRIGTVLSQATFTNCFINFQDPSVYNQGVQAYIMNADNTVFENCHIYHYTDKTNYPTRFIIQYLQNPAKIRFINCELGMPSCTLEANSEEHHNNVFHFENCKFHGEGVLTGPFHLLTGAFDDTAGYAERYLLNVGDEIIFGMGSYDGITNDRWIKHTVITPLLRKSPRTTRVITKSGNEATCAEISGFAVGDGVWVHVDTELTDSFGTVYTGHAGRVKTISAGTMTLEALTDGFVTGTYQIYYARTQKLSEYPFSYMYEESGVTNGNPITSFDDWGDGIWCRKGTRLTDINASNTIAEWLCIESGEFGSVSPPVFKAVYEQSDKINVTLASAGSVAIPGGLAVESVRAKSSSALTAFTIGTSNGGTQIMTATATTGSPTWDLFTINAFDTSNYTLYFGGISSSTDLIIYTK